MSFGVSVPDAGIEWGSYSVKSFVGCISLLSRLWFWRLIFDMLWFSLFAENLLYDGEALSKNNNAGKFSVTVPLKLSECNSIIQQLSL
jgi:hypothetical protein